MNMPSILQKIRHFLRRNPGGKASGHRHSKCRQAARNKAGNGFSGAELPFRRPPDDHRRQEIPLKEALAMAREWQDEMQRWMETLKRHAT